MSDITLCPACGTRFKVSVTQLEAHEGLVRCGRCHEVFNAREHLHDSEPSPQLSLPIDTEPDADLIHKSNLSESNLEEKFTTLAEQVQFVEELTDEVPSVNKSQWPVIIAIPLLTLSLVAQASYYYRVDLAARLPGLKPWLVEYCTLLDCTVSLPQKIDSIAIESSELESDPKQNNIVTLHALIHNSAPYTQTYPSLELTLTDIQDHALARRTYGPRDYLKAGEDEKQGTPANRDLDIKLHLDVTDLKPAGYRLFLFYPR